MSLQDSYNDFVSNLHLACRSVETAMFEKGLRSEEAVSSYVANNPCGGWILSDFDTWHECPNCYAGQRHPEDEGDDAGDAGSAAPSCRVCGERTIFDGVCSDCSGADNDDDDLPF